MKILERELGAIDFAENQQRTLQLPRNYAYRYLSLKLVANVTIAETTAGTVKDSCVANLVRNLMVRANGRDVVKNYDLSFLHRATQFRYGVRPKIISPADTGDTTTIDLEVHAIIDFAMWRSVKPVDTLLDSAGLATLELICTWGIGNDIFSDSFGGTVTVNSAYLYVASCEAFGVPAKTQFIINKEYSIQSQVHTTTANHQIQIPVSNLYRSFILRTVSDDVHVNTILNNIQLKSGTEVYKNLIARHVQMMNRAEFGVEAPVSEAGALGGADYSNRLLDGYYLLEFVKDGRLTECLDTSRLSSLEFILDVTSVGTTDMITVYPVELIVPPVEANV